jgi:hypothetical protein
MDTVGQDQRQQDHGRLVLAGEISRRLAEIAAGGSRGRSIEVVITARALRWCGELLHWGKHAPVWFLSALRFLPVTSIGNKRHLNIMML